MSQLKSSPIWRYFISFRVKHARNSRQDKDNWPEALIRPEDEPDPTWDLAFITDLAKTSFASFKRQWNKNKKAEMGIEPGNEKSVYRRNKRRERPTYTNSEGSIGNVSTIVFRKSMLVHAEFPRIDPRSATRAKHPSPAKSAPRVGTVLVKKAELTEIVEGVEESLIEGNILTSKWGAIGAEIDGARNWENRLRALRHVGRAGRTEPPERGKPREVHLYGSEFWIFTRDDCRTDKRHGIGKRGEDAVKCDKDEDLGLLGESSAGPDWAKPIHNQSLEDKEKKPLMDSHTADRIAVKQRIVDMWWESPSSQLEQPMKYVLPFFFPKEEAVPRRRPDDGLSETGSF
ncbi:hypothetical protein B0H13DRAFT_1863621 [Mycena leptocephala]|nr:hypothetical protein B0H13DRAFT_1863621 [Mycena leptocephala]